MMSNTLLLEWYDVLVLNTGELILNTSLVHYLKRLIPNCSLVILKKNKAPLTEIQNGREITYPDTDIIRKFSQELGIDVVFLTVETLTATLAEGLIEGLRNPQQPREQKYLLYTSDDNMRRIIESFGQQTFSLLKLLRYPLNQSHVKTTIDAIQETINKGCPVIFWLDVDFTLVLPVDSLCLDWTFNPAVFDLLFQLRSAFPNTFNQFQFKLLTSRVPVEQLTDTDKSVNYFNTKLILFQFKEILQHLGLQINIAPNAITALGGYKVCPNTNAHERVSFKSKAEYLAEQSVLLPNTTFVLLDDCGVQRQSFEAALEYNRLPKERAFFIEVVRHQVSVVSTPECFKPNCREPSTASTLSFLATIGRKTGDHVSRAVHDCNPIAVPRP